MVTFGPEIVLASDPGACLTDPDVAWFDGQYFVVYSTRTCPILGPNASFSHLRVHRSGVAFNGGTLNLGAMQAGASAVRIAVSSNGLEAVAARQSLGGAWDFATARFVAGGAGFVPGPHVAWVSGVNQFSLDCFGARCVYATRATAAGTNTIYYMGENGQMISSIRSDAGGSWAFALQVGNESNVLFTQRSMEPYARRWVDVGPQIVSIPPLMGASPRGSIVGARWGTSFVSIVSTDDGRVQVYNNDRPATLLDGVALNGVATFMDATSRGSVVVATGVSTVAGLGAQYFWSETDGRTGIGSVLLGAGFPAGMTGSIRVALETGSGHSGSGMIVYDRAQVMGGVREIVAQRLMCATDADCFDGDPLTPDRCVRAGAEAVCDRAVMDAGVLADVPNVDVPNRDVPNVDVPNPRDVPDSIDVPTDDGAISDGTMSANDSSLESDIVLSGDDVSSDSRTPLMDAGSTADAPREDVMDSAVAMDARSTADAEPLPPRFEFGGGSCACRVGEPAPRSSRTSLGLAFVAVAMVIARRGLQRFRA